MAPRHLRISKQESPGAAKAGARRTITRDDLFEAARAKLPRDPRAVRQILGDMLEEIVSTLATGDAVHLSGFGAFVVLQKGERLGRNPRTGEDALISARRVVSFRASPKLKARVDRSR